MKWMFHICVLSLAMVGSLLQGQSQAANKASVELVASADAVAPGARMQLALVFRFDEGWHIYWKHPGDTGLAPEVKWILPEGFQLSDIRFPGPKRHTDASGSSNILEGEPVLTAFLDVPKAIKADEVTIEADLTWLICKQQCVREKQHVKLKLPVVDSPSKVMQTHEDLFASVKTSHPKPNGVGTDTHVKASVDKKKVKPGETFTLTVQVKIADGWHINSSKPEIEGFKGTDVFIDRPQGLAFSAPRWPTPDIKKDPYLGNMSQYHGTIEIPFKATVEKDAPGGNTPIAGVVYSQACNERGQCHMPEFVEWKTSIEIDAPKAAQADPVNPPVEPDTPTPSPAEPLETADSVDPGVDGNVTVSSDSNANIFTLPVVLTPGIVKDALEGKITGTETEEADITLLWAILLGFIGGMILNIMPCVLPVISIKILSFVQQSGEDPKRVFRLGLVFGLGILVSFWALAFLAIGAKAVTGHDVTWGQQFQHPAFVISMGALVFVFGLNLFGLYEIILPGSASDKLGSAAEKEGYAGAFMKGVLATLLATPCTAPFLFTAMAFALASSSFVILAVATAVGVGMAFPYVLLTARSSWMRYLPKPGPWMVSFKQLMGFMLVGTTIWLLWILGDQGGAGAVVPTVAFYAFLAMGCWLIGKIDIDWSAAKRLQYWVIALGISLVGGWWCYGSWYEPDARSATMAGPTDVADVIKMADEGDWDTHIPWVPYRPGLADEVAAAGRIAYVDYTASWCLTCQTNKKVILETETIRSLMKELGVVPIKADYTNNDPNITKDLKRFKRDAVPLNLVYRPKDM